MTRPTVAIVYAGYVSRGTGVAQHIRQLTGTLPAFGVTADVWSLERLPPGLRLAPHIVQLAGNLVLAPRGFFWRYSLGRRLYRSRIEAAISEGRIDAVIFEDVFTMFPVRVPALCVLHALQSHNLQAFNVGPDELEAARERERAALRNAACQVVTVSEPYLRTVRADLGDTARRVEAVELGLDVTRFPPVPAQRQSDRLELVFVGHLEARKNLWFLPGLLSGLVNRIPAVHLTIVGDGPERDDLASQFAAAGLMAHVTLTGRMPHADVPSLLQRFHVMVHPTAVESFAYTLLEGRLAGLWTLCTEGLDVPESFADARLPLETEAWVSFIADRAGEMREAPSADRREAITGARAAFSSERMTAAYLDRLGLGGRTANGDIAR